MPDMVVRCRATEALERTILRYRLGQHVERIDAILRMIDRELGAL